jgi:hypothetical protein
VTNVTPRQRADLEAIRDYWDPNRIPKAPRTVLLPIPDGSARVAALRSGQIDLVESLPPDTIPSLRAARFQVVQNACPHIWGRLQHLWDQTGDLSNGGFLAHRNPKESEDEPETAPSVCQPKSWCATFAAPRAAPLPTRSASSWKGFAVRKASPPYAAAKPSPRPVLRLVEGVPGSRSDAAWPVIPPARPPATRSRRLRQEARALKEVVAEQALVLRLLKKA